jgi:methyl-accepting chemotaxis protein
MQTKDVENLMAKAFDGDSGAQRELKKQFDEMYKILQEISPVLEKMSVNDYTQNIQGTYTGISADVAKNLNLVHERIHHVANSIAKIGEGDISEYDEYKKIGKRSDGDLIIPGFVKALGAIKQLTNDANMLANAAVEGALSTRADVTKHNGDYRKIVEGINKTLDAVIDPLNIAADYVAKISKGVIPEKITDKYNGDFNILKNNLNQCIDGLGGLVEANATMKRMGQNDHSRGMEGNYLGIFADVKEHVNEVRERSNHIADSLVKISDGDLSESEVYRKIGRRSENDRIVPGFIKTFNALQGLTNDANMLAAAAIEGKLAVRANAEKHQGEYKKVIDGVNKTLDAVIGPVNAAMIVSQEYAKQNFAARMDEALQVSGDFIKFKEALNNIGIAVSSAIKVVNIQTTDLTASAEEALASLNEVSTASAQIATNAQKVNENAERSSEAVAQVLKAMEDMSAAVEEVTSNMENVSNQAKQANESSKNGSIVAEHVAKGMIDISQSTETVNETVKDIEKQMADISKIVILIRDLANQTNLLALNAAIEAARAGDAGRGFAVVATEVKSLAQESRGSAEKIEEMITNLNKSTKKAAVATEDAKALVIKGAQLSSEALEAFRKISTAAEAVASAASEVAAASEEQAATTEEITASVHEVRAQIEGVTKEASNAAAASEEASASINEVNHVVENVNKIADNVSREMSKFTV